MRNKGIYRQDGVPASDTGATFFQISGMRSDTFRIGRIGAELEETLLQTVAEMVMIVECQPRDD